MMSEVVRAYALYEKKSGLEKQKWRCIGVSNRRKDMARLAVKSAELYYDERIDKNVNLGNLLDMLTRKNNHFVIFENDSREDLIIEYSITSIDIPDINRRTIIL